MSSPRARRTRLCSLLLHDTLPRVLLVRSGEGWTLPAVEFDNDDEPEVQDVTDWLLVRHGVRSQFSREVVAAGTEFLQTGERFHVYHVVGHRTGATAESRWWAEEELARADLADETHVAVVSQCLQEAEREAVTLAPWQRRGWLDEAIDWAEVALERPVLEAQSLKSDSGGAVVMLETDAGTTYLKMVGPSSTREAALLRCLAARCPGRVPELIAHDRSRGWFLTRSLGDPLVSTLSRTDAACQAAATLATMQRALLENEHELRTLRLPEAAIDLLPEQVDSLLHETETVTFGRFGLTATELDVFASLRGDLVDACRRLALLGPSGLEHGDFHLGNLCERDGQPAILDWTDATLSHPFLTPFTGLLDGEPPELRARVLAAYLGPWRGFATPEELAETLRLAEWLAPLHLAIGRWRELKRCVPTSRWELRDGAPYFLRCFLDQPATRSGQHRATVTP
ncbi:MAG: phosphotransferase [Acidobacteriota bacterium]